MFRVIQKKRVQGYKTAVKPAINSPLRLERSPAIVVGEVGNKHTIQIQTDLIRRNNRMTKEDKIFDLPLNVDKNLREYDIELLKEIKKLSNVPLEKFDSVMRKIMRKKSSCKLRKIF